MLAPTKVIKGSIFKKKKRFYRSCVTILQSASEEEFVSGMYLQEACKVQCPYAGENRQGMMLHAISAPQGAWQANTFFLVT